MQSFREVVGTFTMITSWGTEGALIMVAEQNLRKDCGLVGLGELVKRVPFEEGQSRRRVAEGPITGVVVRLGVRLGVWLGVTPTMADVLGVRLTVDEVGVDIRFEFELLLCDRVAPTPPPTAAPITTTKIITKTIQNTFGVRPHSFRGGGR